MEFRLNNTRFIKRKINSWNGKMVNDLKNIKVTLLNYTPYEKLINYIPELVTATWNENIEEFRNTILPKDKEEIMKLCFEGKLIPTALKSINITILLEGITSHDVTHILRHSGLSFAADCTGDKYIVDRPIVIPSFLLDMPDEYLRQYVDLNQKAYALYDDICNNFPNKVHIQDARLVLPRTLETFYYITGSLFDFIKFLNQRLDMQVQPKSDNIIALNIYSELVKVYPILLKTIDINAKNNFYCSESKHNLSSKWYNPLPQNETPYTSNMSTVYGNMKEMYGYKNYESVKNELLNKIYSNNIGVINEKSDN